nr:hypothetical protein [Tanacetum cinerariifolium]
MNYMLVVAGNQSNGSSGKARLETIPDKDYILLSLWTQDPLFFSSYKDSPSDGFKPSGEEEIKDAEDLGNEDNKILSTMEPRDNAIYENIVYGCADDLNMPNVEEIVNLNDNEYVVEQIIRDIHSAPQTRRMTKNVTDHEPKKVIQELTYPNWIDAMQDGLLQNKKDERGIVVRNKARLVAQVCTPEEGIDYDEMDMKSAFLYDKIEEEVYVCQHPGFEDPELPDRVYKVEKALYGLHQALRAWIFIIEDTYVNEILKKFGFSTVKTASIPMETSKPLMKDENAKDVDVHFYTSMIGTWMYLTSSRPDIMFTVCACVRF